MITRAKVGTVIKNKKTQELWLIVQKNAAGFYIINLSLNYNPTPLLMLLPRDFSNWTEVTDALDINL